jgi:hypothetical protein
MVTVGCLEFIAVLTVRSEYFPSVAMDKASDWIFPTAPYTSTRMIRVFTPQSPSTTASAALQKCPAPQVCKSANSPLLAMDKAEVETVWLTDSWHPISSPSHGGCTVTIDCLDSLPVLAVQSEQSPSLATDKALDEAFLKPPHTSTIVIGIFRAWSSLSDLQPASSQSWKQISSSLFLATDKAEIETECAMDYLCTQHITD